MSTNKKILVTGGAGYIGSVLTRELLSKGYQVRVLDCLRSGGRALLELATNPNFEFIKGDIRDLATAEKALAGCDAVAHLAAIVGDPACKKEPELARETNLEASKRLYEAATQAGCGQFVFASTCSNYGKMEDPDSFVVETSKLAPISIYAETKVETELFLLNQPQENACKPTCLRFSTVYGLSPRARFDLTVNEFTREIATGKNLEIFGEQFWRPYCHVLDLARSVITVIESPLEKVAFDVFNVGDTEENYTKKMIIEEITKQIDRGSVSYVKKDDDPRDYRVNFSKIKDTLGFTITKRVPDGIKEIFEVLDSGLIEDPYHQEFSNI